MKARVKETGEIVDVIHKIGNIYSASDGNDYFINGLEFNVEETDWTALRNQAAIAAMQGMLSNPELVDAGYDYRLTIEKAAVGYADALIEELKKGE